MVVASPLSPFHLKIETFITPEKWWVFEPETIKNDQTPSRQYSSVPSPQRFKADFKPGVQTEFILLRVETVASSRERREAPGKCLCCVDLAAEIKHSFRHGFYDWPEQF
jgi:hypothetical protein